MILIHFLGQFPIELISFKITTILNEVLLLALKPAIFFSLFTSVKLIILILIHNLLDFFSGLNLSQFFFRRYPSSIFEYLLDRSSHPDGETSVQTPKPRRFGEFPLSEIAAALQTLPVLLVQV